MSTTKRKAHKRSTKPKATAKRRAAAPTATPPAPAPAVSPSVVATTLQEKVVLLILTIRAPGNTRRVRDKSILDTEADKDSLQVTKRLLEAKEHKELQSLDMTVRAYVKRMALPSPFKEGVYAVPLALLDTIEKQLTEYNTQRTAAVKALQTVYEGAVEKARLTLGPLFRAADYMPTAALEYAYRMEWQYVSLAAPDQMRSLDSAMFRREQERLQKQWEEAVGDMRDALRVGLSELVNDLVQRLSAAEGDEKRVKPSKLLERFTEFLNNFQARNVTGDAQLEALAGQAKQLLKGVTTQGLIQSTDIRAQVQQGFKAVQATLGKLELEAKGRRRISFDEE